MMKDKFYTLINISGLTIGIAGCLFVVLYVWNELSYDKFHHDYENIYHVALTGKIGEQEINTSTSSPPVGPSMVENIPGIESTVRVNTNTGPVFYYEDKAFAEPEVAYVDSNFFEFFDFKLLNGEKNLVLAKPNSLVLTEKLAEKYFGNENPVGQIVQLGNEKIAYTVTGICENPPPNSHLKFTAVMSLSSLYTMLPPEVFQSWLSNSWQTYVRKNPNTSVKEVNEKLEELTRINAGPTLEQVLGINWDQMHEAGGKYGFWIYPMTDIRLNSVLDHYPTPQGDMKYIYLFSAIGIFLLIIACINFMNLSTAKSAGRAREVGLRKTLGSTRGQMIVQFLSESVIYALIGTLLSLFIVYILLPNFNLLAGVELSFSPVLSWTFLLILTGLVIFVGLLAGSYPALFLTGFNIIEVLKGGKTSMKSGKVRSGLVVFQFIISICLIISTGAVYQQLQYVQNKNLGFDKDHIMLIYQTNRLGNNQVPFKNQLNDLPYIIQTSYTNNYFPGVNNTTVFKAAGTEADHIIGFYYGDWDHGEAMGFNLEKGRFFNREFPSDSLGIIVNEATVQQLGWEEPIGSELKYYADGPTPIVYKVVGVVSDYNFESLKDEVRPIIFALQEKNNNLVVRFKGSPEDLITNLKSIWNNLSEGEPFEYRFMDEAYAALFKEEQRMGKLFTVLSVLAVFIACLGLFGLSSFMAEQRVKEIGIRKTLGASTANLTTILTREFNILILIAFVLSVYPSWYFMSEWLHGFAYHITLEWWLFAGAGITGFIISWVTVFYQAMKAARANPVNSLKYE